MEFFTKKEGVLMTAKQTLYLKCYEFLYLFENKSKVIIGLRVSTFAEYGI